MAKNEKDLPEIQGDAEALELAAGKNEFLPFAFQSTSNVIDQKAYEALQDRLSGFVSGVALAERLNKVWRQSSLMSAALGQFLAGATGKDVIDDGDINKIVALLNESIGIVAPGKVVSVNGKQGVVVLDFNDVGAAPIKDAHLQGEPSAPTPKAGDSTDKLATTAFVANAIGSIDAVPKGCIVMWSGAAANIPGGWHLCDGQNGTPNLIDRFVLGGRDKGAAGGSTKISIDQVPAHTHTGSTSAGGGHSHGVSDGGHYHSIAATASGEMQSGNGWRGPGFGGSNTSSNGSNVGVQAVGDHSHNVSLDNTGGGQDYLPPYFQLCYIMKA